MLLDTFFHSGSPGTTYVLGPRFSLFISTEALQRIYKAFQNKWHDEGEDEWAWIPTLSLAGCEMGKRLNLAEPSFLCCKLVTVVELS